MTTQEAQAEMTASTVRSLTVAVLGAGSVGRTLARAWAHAGHAVILGSRQPDATRKVDTVANLGDDQAAVEAIDALARLWFRLAFSRGYGRRLAWKLLTEADDYPSSAPSDRTQ